MTSHTPSDDEGLREEIRCLPKTVWPSEDSTYPNHWKIDIEELMALISQKIIEAKIEGEKNGIAWTVGVIDDVHIYTDSDLNSYDDKIFKGIKNTIRDRYRLITGIDPASDYPIDVTLTTKQDTKENV